MWYVGAATTVTWASSWFKLPSGAFWPGCLLWLIPLGISYIELDQEGIIGLRGFSIWLAVEAIDMVTSFGGIAGFLDGKGIGPILFASSVAPKGWFEHWQWDTQLNWFNVLCLVLAIFFAYAPEKLAHKHWSRLWGILQRYRY
jgi:hypothetical protein